MGLFSSKKKIYVSSVAYNLAGALSERESYLKTSGAKAILTGDPRDSYAAQIVSDQLNGPTFDQRFFFRWSTRHYERGLMSGSVRAKRNVNGSIAEPYLPVPTGHTPLILGAFVDTGDVSYWAEKFILENRPERIADDWVSDIDINNLVRITYSDGTSETMTFPDFTPGVPHLFVYYNSTDETDTSYWTYGPVVENDAVRPDTTSFTLNTSSNYSTDVVLTDTVETIVDGVSTIETTNRTETFLGVEEDWQFYENFPASDGYQTQTRHYLWIRTDFEIDETVVSETTEQDGVTTTVITTTQSLRTVYDHKLDLRENITLWNPTGTQRLWIYRLGSGNTTLDALNVDIREMPQFFPVIPFRIHNKSVMHPDYAGVFPLYKRAFKKATGTKIEKIIEDIEDNEQIGDIDHAFMLHGVELNTQENQGKRYVYEFLRNLMGDQATSLTDLNNWVATQTSYDQYIEDLNNWHRAMEYGNYAEVGPMPQYTLKPLPDVTTLEVSTRGELGLPYKILLNWVTITETEAIGLGKTGAKKGDFWWEVRPSITRQGVPYYSGGEASIEIIPIDTIECVRLYWQDGSNSYRYLDIWGMIHQNFVYGNKSVDITAVEAINDPDESGFSIPLHYQTLKEMPIILANELYASSRLLVFNCYVVKKIRWYQRFIFKIIFAVIVSLVFFPAGAGILGTNAAVGASIGLTGYAALVAGAVANALAAVIISTVIQVGAVAIFGEKLGAIIAAIATFVTFQYMANFNITGSWSFNWGDLMKADNLLKLTDAVAGGVANWAQGEMKALAEEGQQAFKDYKSEMKEIERKTLEILGYGGAFVDPLMFTEMQDSSLNNRESSATFLTRTLLTGSEVADLSLNMIGSFADMSLTLPKFTD